MGDTRAGPKMTVPTQLVLLALLEQPDQERYGLELSELAGLATGTIHPILARLERVGWVSSRWEVMDPKREGRPRRRYYQLNPNSIASVKAALARAKTPTFLLQQLRRQLAGGWG